MSKDWTDAHNVGGSARKAADAGWSTQDAAGGGNAEARWPVLGSKATHGIIGQIAELATRDSEADPVAVMATALTWSAALLGRNCYTNVGDGVHHPRLFCSLVGASSLSRKGTSVEPVRRIVTRAEAILQGNSTLAFPGGVNLQISHGPLSTGEGLIAAIRDKRDDDDGGGVDDKRLFCIESELGAALKACQRSGNTLSSLLRVAWDGSTLEPLTKKDRMRASNPHICLIAHITRQELAQLLTSTDVWNGFANRFLWVAVRRAKVVPLPKPMADGDVARVSTELARVVAYAHAKDGDRARLVMSNAAQDHWVTCYSELTHDYAGVLGAVTSCGAAQALRLAMTYALLDGADRIELHHIEAGLTFWRYCFDSAAFIFRGAEIDPVAQKILDALATGPKSQTDIVNLFGRHLDKDRITTALHDLEQRGKIRLTIETTTGRSRRVWSLPA